MAEWPSQPACTAWPVTTGVGSDPHVHLSPSPLLFEIGQRITVDPSSFKSQSQGDIVFDVSWQGQLVYSRGEGCS